MTDGQTDGRTDGFAIAYSALSMLSRANKMATNDDVYGVDSASGSYLYAFSKFSRRRNRQTRPRRFWVYDMLRRRDDLGEFARLV